MTTPLEISTAGYVVISLHATVSKAFVWYLKTARNHTDPLSHMCRDKVWGTIFENSIENSYLQTEDVLAP